MEKLNERANELIQEREKLVVRFNEINGALQELEHQSNTLSEPTTEEETNG
jgi:hypothetical protein